MQHLDLACKGLLHFSLVVASQNRCHLFVGIAEIGLFDGVDLDELTHSGACSAI